MGKVDDAIFGRRRILLHLVRGTAFSTEPFITLIHLNCVFFYLYLLHLSDCSDDLSAPTSPGHCHYPLLLVHHHRGDHARHRPLARGDEVVLVLGWRHVVGRGDVRAGEVVHLVVKNYPS